jgi:hypothetical protein
VAFKVVNVKDLSYNLLTHGSKLISPTQWAQFTPQKHYYFYASDSHFCKRLSEPQGLLWPECLARLKKLIHLIGSRTHYLPACSILP